MSGPPLDKLLEHMVKMSMTFKSCSGSLLRRDGFTYTIYKSLTRAKKHILLSHIFPACLLVIFEPQLTPNCQDFFQFLLSSASFLPLCCCWVEMRCKVQTYTYLLQDPPTFYNSCILPLKQASPPPSFSASISCWVEMGCKV